MKVPKLIIKPNLVVVMNIPEFFTKSIYRRLLHHPHRLTKGLRHQLRGFSLLDPRHWVGKLAASVTLRQVLHFLHKQHSHCHAFEDGGEWAGWGWLSSAVRPCYIWQSSLWFWGWTCCPHMLPERTETPSVSPGRKPCFSFWITGTFSGSV